MKIRKKADEIWAEYQRGVSYNTGIGLYDNVERNNNFYNDKQWEGVNAPDLDKPVFNFLKPVVSYYIAMLISDDIAANIELAGGSDALEKYGRGKTTIKMTRSAEDGARSEAESGAALMPEMGTAAAPVLPGLPGGAMDEAREMSMNAMIPKILSQELDNIIERTNMKFKNRKMIRNCAVDGDGCFYIWFDPDAPTGFDYKGEIKIDLVDNTNVLFGNPSDPEVQEQPYILVAYRCLTEEVRDEARACGTNPDDITPDNESYYMNANKDHENDYTTVILKMWKEKGTVHTMKCTRDAIVKREADTEYKLYPLAYMNWESVKNCYHGVSPITGKIQNQIFVNKIYAMAMQNVLNNAFPKVMYDRTKVPAWNNKVGAAVAVAGNPNDAIFANFKAGDMSSDVMNMAGLTITQTKELMGASDAALGNVKPDNTSAIIAVQKASGMPLDIQKKDFYNFVENCVRIFIEIMRVNYGVRKVAVTDADGTKLQGEFDFSTLGRYAFNLNIDIGAGSYWSELMQIQTLDNLMANKIIPDALTYLDAVPEGYIKNKNKIIEKIKEQQGGGMPDMAAMGGGMPQMGGMPDMAAMGGAMPQMDGMPDMAAMGADMGGMPISPDMAAGEMPPDMGMPDGEELPPELAGMDAHAGMTEEEMADIVSELLKMDIEADEVYDVIEAMDIPDEEKEQILVLYEMAAQEAR